MVTSASLMTRALAAALVGVAAFTAGCDTLQRQPPASDAKSSTVAAAAPDPKPAKPGVPVATILATWSPKIELGTNPVDNAPMPAIVGRVYLFDAKDRTVEADGKVTVELFNDTNRQVGKPCEKLGNWTIDPKLLAGWRSKDPMIGVGYSMVLPWPTFKSEISQIHMVVHYIPRSGQTLTLADQIMTVEQSPELLQAQQTTPAQPSSAVAAAASR
jgi:hypothetical protein